jgi:hypothetical protein
MKKELSSTSMLSISKSLKNIPKLSHNSLLSSTSLSSLSLTSTTLLQNKQKSNKNKLKKKHRYSLARNSKSSVSKLGSIQEETEDHDKDQEYKSINNFKCKNECSIEYLQAIKAFRNHLNEVKIRQQNKNIISVIKDTVRSIEATLILNSNNNKNNNTIMLNNNYNNNNNIKTEKSKYTLTRVIKKVTFHPDKTNDSSDKRVELLYIWGADNKKKISYA